jgi:hypothetical protein
MSKIVDDHGALTIYPKAGSEVWVEHDFGDTYEIGIDSWALAYINLSRKELKAFRKAIKRVLKES